MLNFAKILLFDIAIYIYVFTMIEALRNSVNFQLKPQKKLFSNLITDMCEIVRSKIIRRGQTKEKIIEGSCTSL
jgi:hypothetical protein